MVPTLQVQEKPQGGRVSLIAKASLSPGGEVTLIPGGPAAPGYELVEIRWYPEGLMLTIPGAAPGAITRVYITGEGRNIDVLSKWPEEDASA